jgi:hypothetical protein
MAGVSADAVDMDDAWVIVDWLVRAQRIPAAHEWVDGLQSNTQGDPMGHMF